MRGCATEIQILQFDLSGILKGHARARCFVVIEGRRLLLLELLSSLLHLLSALICYAHLLHHLLRSLIRSLNAYSSRHSARSRHSQRKQTAELPAAPQYRWS